MARTRIRGEDESPSLGSFTSCVSYLTASAGASVTFKKREDSREANHTPDPRAHTSRRREVARAHTQRRHTQTRTPPSGVCSQMKGKTSLGERERGEALSPRKLRGSRGGGNARMERKTWGDRAKVRDL